MKSLVFVTNFIHHHQLPVADEFYRILGSGYTFVAIEQLPEWLIKGGYDPNLDRSYIVRAYASKDCLQRAQELVNSADVVIIGGVNANYLIRNRLRNRQITFRYSERWFRNSLRQCLSLRFLLGVFKNHFIYRKSPLYMLCTGAFVSWDMARIFCYPGKCFKWGYMTKIEDLDVDLVLKNKRSSFSKIMWCARFLKLKHPELPVILAKRLKELGYSFCIDMYGSGEELENVKRLVKDYSVEDVVSFKGNVSNREILLEMRNHNIFLFTSDRLEGWGAVANEAMSNCCALVGSNEIGAIPYLVNDDVNGCIFNSNDIDSLEAKVRKLIDNPNFCENISRNAYLTMKNIWSPKNAVKNFFCLADFLIEKKGKLPLEGPCSIAEIIKV